MLKNLNKFSKIITQSKTNGAAQAMLYAIGMTKNDLKKPQIGICSMWYESNPCNKNLNILSNIIKNNIDSEQLQPFQFNTIGISDGITMGTSGMKYSLPSRELISDSIESVVSAHHYDSLICVPGCDKNLPGSAMAMLRLNRPSLLVYGGSMPPSLYKNKELDIVSAFESYGQLIKGEINENERDNILQNSCNKSCGSCSGLYTANTMAMCLETMGLTLPNSSSNPSMSSEKMNECKEIGLYIHNMIKYDLKMSDIIEKESFLNAIKMLYLTGGSTNGVIHLLAIANEINIDLSIDDFINLQNTPILLNMKPHGENMMYHLHQIGGTSSFIKYLIENDLINGNCLTVTGKTLYENVKNSKDLDFNKQNVVLPINKPFKLDSHIRILKGNLSPNGCIAKIYKNDKIYTGEALVFNSENKMIDALKNNKIKENNFIIIKNQGESVGCPEMLMPTSALIGYFGDNAPPLATDGRFSGGSKGILIAHLPDANKNTITSKIKNGDLITIDLNKNSINLDISEEDLEFRTVNYISASSIIPRGYLRKFSKLVGNITNGYSTNK